MIFGPPQTFATGPSLTHNSGHFGSPLPFWAPGPPALPGLPMASYDTAISGNVNPRNCVFSLERCILFYQQTRKHAQIITWLQLNHSSLLIRCLCNSVKSCLLSNTPWIQLLLFVEQCTAAYNTCCVQLG